MTGKLPIDDAAMKYLLTDENQPEEIRIIVRTLWGLLGRVDSHDAKLSFLVHKLDDAKIIDGLEVPD